MRLLQAVPPSGTKGNGGSGANGGIALQVPPDVFRAQCARYRKHGKPWYRSRLQNLGDYDMARAGVLQLTMVS
jgi:hypothetical protein